jgi:glycosyltransferase involved in cell wall biosynthesis
MDKLVSKRSKYILTAVKGWISQVNVRIAFKVLGSKFIIGSEPLERNDSRESVDLYLIKEGTSIESGGIGIWFRGLSWSSAKNLRDCLVYSSHGVTRLSGSSNRLDGNHYGFAKPQMFLLNFFRIGKTRKVFAKFGLDAEEVYNYFFVFFFIKYVNNLSNQRVKIERIIVPIYEGYGAYLPHDWPVWVGLVSGTSHAIADLDISRKRYQGHYLPKIMKEQILLERYPNRIAISEDILSEYANVRSDEEFKISHPQIFDPMKPKKSQQSIDLVTWENRRNVILFLGRLEPRKGYDILLKAWNLSNLASQGFELHMCGEISNILSVEEQNSIGVKFKGRITTEEKSEYLSVCKLVVVPSRFESFGIVTIEAMAFGTPVLVANVNGLRYIASLAKSVNVFSGGDSLDCAIKMTELLNSRDQWNNSSMRSRKDFESYFLLS